MNPQYRKEAHAKIDTFPEETVQIIVQLMNKMTTGSARKEKNLAMKKRFLETAGKIDIDGDAIAKLRKESLI